MIDAYVMPNGIAAILSNPEALKNLKDNFVSHLAITQTHRSDTRSSSGCEALSLVAMKSSSGSISLRQAGAFTISTLA